MIEQSFNHGVGVITLNQPHKANALSTLLLYELQETLQKFKENPHVHCVIITGKGEKAFCAGADLKERAKMQPNEVKKAVQLIRHTVSLVESLPQPVIASINGAAFGGGLELALACDIRIASTEAKMGLTETSLGIIPGAGGTQRLPRLIGMSKAKELIFTAKKITANEAVLLGLVSNAVPPQELEAYTFGLAKQIAANGPIAVKAAKRAINRGMETDLSHALQIEEMCYQITIPTEDRLEGLRAFQEKRKPVYKGQ